PTRCTLSLHDALPILEWSLRGGPARQRASRASDARRAAPRRAGAGRAARPPRNSRATRDADGAPLARAAMNKALDLITRVRGVRSEEHTSELQSRSDL